MSFRIEDGCKVICLDSCTVQTADPMVKSFFQAHHIPVSEDGNLTVSVRTDNSRRMTYVEQSRKVTDEKYILAVSEMADGVCAEIVCSAPRGLYYALCDLYRQIQSGTAVVSVREEYPLFSMRGYIEGFYGEPWKADERVQMLELMSAYRMNTYFYAPKDDPYHREQWSVLYPEQALSDLEKLVQKAKACHVDFWFCIAPGLDLCYSSTEQFDALMRKCRQLYSIGVRRFGLLLDDIPEDLQFVADQEKFGETVTAHIDLINRFQDAVREMDGDAQMAVCPLQYHGVGNEYYISKLGQGIDASVLLFWTGHNICSQELTVPEAVCFTQSTRHPPLYWDNYPVNDAEMYQEMHLGAYSGRDRDLYRYCSGIIVNCMPYFEANKIPLLTIADYLWDPMGYDAASSWQYALETVIGADADLFAVFAEHVTTSCLKTDVSPNMTAVLSDVRTAVLTGDVKSATLQISAYSERVQQCRKMLENRKGEKLYSELSHWIEKFGLFAEGIALCDRLFQTGDAAIKPDLQKKLQQFLQHPAVMTDFAYRAAVEWVLQKNFGGMTK